MPVIAKSDADAPAKAEAADKLDKIQIKVVEGNNELSFNLKKGFSMGKLMAAYASQVNKQAHLLRFHYDGERIKKEDTPLSLGMEEGDTIEVFMEQTGGN